MKRVWSFFFLMFSTLFGTVLTFIAQIILAKYYSIEEVGIYAVILNLVNIIALFIGFGMTDFVIKEYAKIGDRIYLWNKYIIIYLFINMFISGVIYYISLQYILPSDYHNLGYLFFILVLVQGAITLASITNQIEQNFKSMAMLNMILYLSRTFPIFIIIIIDQDFKNIGVWTLLVGIISLFFTFPYIYKYFTRKLNIGINRNAIEERIISFGALLQESIPYGLMGLLYFIYYQGAVLFLAFFHDSKEVAIYSVAFSFISLAYTFPNIIFRKLFFTKIHIMSVENIEKLHIFYIRVTKIMFLVSIIISVLIYGTSDFLIHMFYGDDYRVSGELLKYLSVAIFFRYMYALSGTVLSTKNYIAKKLKIQSTVALLSFVISLIIIPLWGASGAVFVAIGNEVLLCILFLFATQQYFLKER